MLIAYAYLLTNQKWCTALLEEIENTNNSLQASTYFKVTEERVWDAYKFILDIVYANKIESTTALKINLKSVSLFYPITCCQISLELNWISTNPN